MNRIDLYNDNYFAPLEGVEEDEEYDNQESSMIDYDLGDYDLESYEDNENEAW